jgi:hypothetical protein
LTGYKVRTDSLEDFSHEGTLLTSNPQKRILGMNGKQIDTANQILTTIGATWHVLTHAQRDQFIQKAAANSDISNTEFVLAVKAGMANSTDRQWHVHADEVWRSQQEFQKTRKGL